MLRVEAGWEKYPGCVLHWREWGGDSVAFEVRSGATYQFSPLAAAVMACFEQQACSAELLAQTIAADLGTEADDELRTALSAQVAQFLKLGWIVPITTS